MSYFTYRIFKSVSLEKLRAKVAANLALFEPGSSGHEMIVHLFQGQECSAMLMGYLRRESWLLTPVGQQLGCVWMDVRYQDGDAWDLSAYEDAEHRVSHNVNPWAYDEEEFVNAQYDQKAVDFRINRVCELWPEQAPRIRRHLLPWREPIVREGVTNFVARTGKAYETDEHEYGDANQVLDFLKQFGIDETKPTTVGKRAKS